MNRSDNIHTEEKISLEPSIEVAFHCGSRERKKEHFDKEKKTEAERERGGKSERNNGFKMEFYMAAKEIVWPEKKRNEKKNLIKISVH